MSTWCYVSYAYMVFCNRMTASTSGYYYVSIGIDIWHGTYIYGVGQSFSPEITTSSTFTCIRMERRVPDSASLRSSITEEDLEDARQRLLLHQEEDDTEYTTPLPPHQPARSQAQYGSVSTIQSSQATRPSNPKRYRLPFLILLVFDFGLIVFLSIICSVVGNTLYVLFFRSRLSICGLWWGTGHYVGVVCTPIILGSWGHGLEF